ncbi:hypothetical protein IWQ62_001003, partial [Dispira parvispora]
MLPVLHDLESLATRLWNLPVPRTPSKAKSPSLLSFNTALLQWIHRCRETLSFSDGPKNESVDQLWQLFTTVAPKLAGGKLRHGRGPSILVQFLEHGGVTGENKQGLCQLVTMTSQTGSLHSDDKVVWVAKRLKAVEPTKPGSISLEERTRWLLRLLNHMLVDRPSGALESSSTTTPLEPSLSQEGLLQVSRLVLQVADAAESQEVRSDIVQLVERITHLSSSAMSKYSKPFSKLFIQWAMDPALVSTRRSDFVERVYGVLKAPYFPASTKTLALRKVSNLLANKGTISTQSEGTLISHVHGSSFLITEIFRSMGHPALQQRKSRPYTLVNQWVTSLTVILRNSESPAVWQVGMEAIHHLMMVLVQIAARGRLQSTCVDCLWVLLQYFHDMLATTNQQGVVALPSSMWCCIGQWAKGCINIMQLDSSFAISIVRKVLLDRANTLNPLLDTFFTHNISDATFPSSVLRLLVQCVLFLVRQHRGAATGKTKCPWYDVNINMCTCVAELVHSLLVETTYFQRVLWSQSVKVVKGAGCGDLGPRNPGPTGFPDHFFLKNLEGPQAKMCQDHPTLYLAYFCPDTSDLFHGTLHKISSSDHNDDTNNTELSTVTHHTGATASPMSIAKFIQIYWTLLTQLISTLSVDGPASDSSGDDGLIHPTSSRSLIDDMCTIWLAQSWSFINMASNGIPYLSSLWPTWVHCLNKILLGYQTLGPFAALLHFILQAGPKPVPHVALVSLVGHTVALWDKSTTQLSSPSYTSWKALVIPALSGGINAHLQCSVNRDQLLVLAPLLSSMIGHFGAHYLDTTLLTTMSRLMNHSDSEVRRAFGELRAKIPGIAQVTPIALSNTFPNAYLPEIGHLSPLFSVKHCYTALSLLDLPSQVPGEVTLHAEGGLHASDVRQRLRTLFWATWPGTSLYPESGLSHALTMDSDRLMLEWVFGQVALYCIYNRLVLPCQPAPIQVLPTLEQILGNLTNQAQWWGDTAPSAEVTVVATSLLHLLFTLERHYRRMVIVPARDNSPTLTADSTGDLSLTLYYQTRRQDVDRWFTHQRASYVALAHRLEAWTSVLGFGALEEYIQATGKRQVSPKKALSASQNWPGLLVNSLFRLDDIYHLPSVKSLVGKSTTESQHHGTLPNEQEGLHESSSDLVFHTPWQASLVALEQVVLGQESGAWASLCSLDSDSDVVVQSAKRMLAYATQAVLLHTLDEDDLQASMVTMQNFQLPERTSSPPSVALEPANWKVVTGLVHALASPSLSTMTESLRQALIEPMSHTRLSETPAAASGLHWPLSQLNSLVNDYFLFLVSEPAKYSESDTSRWASSSIDLPAVFPTPQWLGILDQDDHLPLEAKVTRWLSRWSCYVECRPSAMLRRQSRRHLRMLWQFYEKAVHGPCPWVPSVPGGTQQLDGLECLSSTGMNASVRPTYPNRRNEPELDQLLITILPLLLRAAYEGGDTKVYSSLLTSLGLSVHATSAPSSPSIQNDGLAKLASLWTLELELTQKVLPATLLPKIQRCIEMSITGLHEQLPPRMVAAYVAETCALVADHYDRFPDVWQRNLDNDTALAQLLRPADFALPDLPQEREPLPLRLLDHAASLAEKHRLDVDPVLLGMSITGRLSGGMWFRLAQFHEQYLEKLTPSHSSVVPWAVRHQAQGSTTDTVRDQFYQYFYWVVHPLVCSDCPWPESVGPLTVIPDSLCNCVHHTQSLTLMQRCLDDLDQARVGLSDHIHLSLTRFCHIISGRANRMLPRYGRISPADLLSVSPDDLHPWVLRSHELYAQTLDTASTNAVSVLRAYGRFLTIGHQGPIPSQNFQTRTLEARRVAVGRALYLVGLYPNPESLVTIPVQFSSLDVSFWLVYLPQLTRLLIHPHRDSRQWGFMVLLGLVGKAGSLFEETSNYMDAEDFMGSLLLRLFVITRTSTTSGSKTLSSSDLHTLRHSLALVSSHGTLNHSDILEARIRKTVLEFDRIMVLWEESWAIHLDQLYRKARTVQQILCQPPSLVHEKDSCVVALRSLVDSLSHLLVRQVTATEMSPHEVNFTHRFVPTLRRLLGGFAAWHISDQLEPLVRETEATAKQLHRMTLVPRTFDLASLSPWLAQAEDTGLYLPFTMISGKEDPTNEHVLKVCPRVTAIPTKTRPKKFLIQSSTGRTCPYMLKGMEDLRVDEVVTRCLTLFNHFVERQNAGGIMGANHPAPIHEVGSATTYTVVPLGVRAGLVQWVPNVT